MCVCVGNICKYLHTYMCVCVRVCVCVYVCGCVCVYTNMYVDTCTCQ